MIHIADMGATADVFPPHSMQPAEPSLMERVADGDGRAMRMLVERWKRPLLAFFQRSVGNLHDAEDLTLETMERVLRYADRYDERGTLDAWIFRIARSRLGSFYRWQRIRPFLPGVRTTGATDEDGVERDPVDGLRVASFRDGVEAGEIVDHLLARLPESQRTPLLLLVQQGLSCRAIAETLRLSEAAVKVRIHRARRELKAMYAKGEWNHD